MGRYSDWWVLSANQPLPTPSPSKKDRKVCVGGVDEILNMLGKCLKRSEEDRVNGLGVCGRMRSYESTAGE